MILEEAIVARLAEIVPDVDVYPVDVDEGVETAYIAYRQKAAMDDHGHSGIVHRATFEFDIAAAVGGERIRYFEAKTLAGRVTEAFRHGFVVGDFCVRQIDAGTIEDIYAKQLPLYGVRAEFTFIHDSIF